MTKAGPFYRSWLIHQEQKPRCNHRVGAGCYGADNGADHEKASRTIGDSNILESESHQRNYHGHDRKHQANGAAENFDECLKRNYCSNFVHAPDKGWAARSTRAHPVWAAPWGPQQQAVRRERRSVALILFESRPRHQRMLGAASSWPSMIKMQACTIRKSRLTTFVFEPIAPMKWHN